MTSRAIILLPRPGANYRCGASSFNRNGHHEIQRNDSNFRRDGLCRFLPPARETLHLDVFIGEADIWDVTSTPIYGKSEAILVDCGFG